MCIIHFSCTGTSFLSGKCVTLHLSDTNIQTINGIMELKGTKTEANLQTAFAGESQAHTKYLYYAVTMQL